MCLVLMFCVISKPICEAHAVSEVIIGGLYYILASVAAYLGITFATNEDAQKALSDWFYGLGDDIKSMLEGYAANWVSGYNTIIEWEKSGWQTIVQSCADFFNSYMPDYSSVDVDVTVDNSDNILGFDNEHSWGFTVPEHSGNCTLIADLGQSTLSIGDQILTFELSHMYPDAFGQQLINDLSGNNDMRGRYHSVKCNSDGFEWFYLDWEWNSYNGTDPVIPSGYYSTFCGGSSLPWNNGYNNYNEQYTGYQMSVDPYGHRLFLFDNRTNPGSGNLVHYKDKDGNFYSLLPDSDGKWSFVCTDSTKPNYYGETFDSFYDAVGYFAFQCGISIPGSSYQVDSYVPSGTSKNSISVDSERLTEKVAEAGAITSDTFDTVVPGTQTALDEMVANPDLVTDTTAEWVYNAEIPAISSDPLLWQTKFPFCLPFDLYNLFTGFSADAEAPVWHLLVLPENSFGMDNEAFYFDIDFGANGLDIFVKYLRFFVGAAFVVWLILISRKLIGAE